MAGILRHQYEESVKQLGRKYADCLSSSRVLTDLVSTCTVEFKAVVYLRYPTHFEHPYNVRIRGWFNTDMDHIHLRRHVTIRHRLPARLLVRRAGEVALGVWDPGTPLFTFRGGSPRGAPGG